MLWFVGLAVLAFYFAVFYKSQTFSETVYEWGKTPSIIAILFKVFVRILRRRQGHIYQAANSRNDHDERRQKDNVDDVVHLAPSQDEVIVINGYRVTSELVARYKQVCDDKKDNRGVTQADTSDRAVPLCFPECLFMHNLLLLVCKPSFKLSPLGLIHIGQTIKQHGDLDQLLDGPCSLEAQTAGYRLMPRGIEVDINVRVIAASDLCVWSGVATLLSRSQRTQGSGGTSSSSRQQTGDPDWEDKRVSSQQIEAAGDTGIRYAGVSGDWNPHHLYPWSARLLGFRAPIAHGLWTLSRTVALITDTTKDQSQFKEVECRFKRPFFLPGTAVLEYYADGSTYKFRVTDSKTGAPHLVGSLS